MEYLKNYAFFISKKDKFKAYTIYWYHINGHLHAHM